MLLEITFFYTKLTLTFNFFIHPSISPIYRKTIAFLTNVFSKRLNFPLKIIPLTPFVYFQVNTSCRITYIKYGNRSVVLNVFMNIFSSKLQFNVYD